MAKEKSRKTGIKYRLALEKIVEKSSQRLIDAPVHRIDREIDRVLQTMGEFAQVDRSYLFIFSEDGRRMSNTHEWCAPGIEPQIEMLQDLPVDNFPWIVQELKAGRNINLTNLEELPPEASNEKEVLRVQDIQALAIVPLRHSNVLKGYLGFDSTREHVRWKNEDFALLQTIGNLLVSALVRQRMEKQLLQSYKMEALGNFAGGIAHDFNNILATIKGHIQLLRSYSNITPEEEELIDAAFHGTESGIALTDQLLSFYGESPRKKERLHVHQILSDSLEMLQRLIPENISVRARFNARNDLIITDYSQIEQIVMNLVKNSVDAMSDGGTLTLSTDNIEVPSKKLVEKEGKEGVEAEVYLLLKVKDTGCGMSEASTEKVFEPFFTTKEEDGTGLGLSTVYRIIQQHDGYLEIDSKKGEGTSIDIYLPVE